MVFIIFAGHPCGKGKDSGSLQEGGFGGGGALYYRNRKVYYGAGGGFTGGSTRVRDYRSCEGGGGGSFSIDKNATFDHHHVDVTYGKCKIEFIT